MKRLLCLAFIALVALGCSGDSKESNKKSTKKSSNESSKKSTKKSNKKSSKSKDSSKDFDLTDPTHSVPLNNSLFFEQNDSPGETEF